jgi:hypothetical protein
MKNIDNWYSTSLPSHDGANDFRKNSLYKGLKRRSARH